MERACVLKSVRNSLSKHASRSYQRYAGGGCKEIPVKSCHYFPPQVCVHGGFYLSRRSCSALPRGVTSITAFNERAGRAPHQDPLRAASRPLVDVQELTSAVGARRTLHLRAVTGRSRTASERLTSLRLPRRVTTPSHLIARQPGESPSPLQLQRGVLSPAPLRDPRYPATLGGAAADRRKESASSLGVSQASQTAP